MVVSHKVTYAIMVIFHHLSTRTSQHKRSSTQLIFKTLWVTSNAVRVLLIHVCVKHMSLLWWVQVDAELDAGASLPWSPLMATYLAAGFDEDQNFCAVIPYAGCTVDSLMHHHQYQTKTTAKDRLALSKMVILQGLTAYDIMQKTVRGCCSMHGMCWVPVTSFCLYVICCQHVSAAYRIAEQNMECSHTCRLG